MDARDKYAYMTGDFENAYKMREDGVEGYFYTDKMMERAVSKLENASDTGEQTYMQNLMEKRGPHTGSYLGFTYPLSQEYGRENFQYINNDEDLNFLQKAYRGSQFMTDRRVMPSAKMGFLRNLFEYLRD
tara:strand:- start:385 stop:774 length:390 start_codon:yes stop_codon:yes gene_type:complete